MGDSEGRDGDVADGEVRAGVEVLDRGKQGGIGFGGGGFVFFGVGGLGAEVNIGRWNCRSFDSG